MIESAIAEISRQPLAWPQTPYRARKFLIDRFPHAIIYFVHDDILTIVAIAHTSRRPGYWHERLKH